MPENMHNEDEGQNIHKQGLSEDKIRFYEAQFDKMADDFAELGESVKPQVEAWWEQLAGEHYNLMLSSQEQAFSYFSSPDPRLRRVAVRIATNHWTPTTAIIEECKRMALEDRDEGVQGVALDAIGSYYLGSKDPQVGGVLATIATDEKIALQVRIRAYIALVFLHGYLDSGISANIFTIDSVEHFDESLLHRYY
jgi:hypothetical protein